MTFNVFLIMMILHPAVVQAAQREIENVTGSDRLPTFEDRPSLPYIDCILKEVLRYDAKSVVYIDVLIAHRIHPPLPLSQSVLNSL